MAGLVTHMTGWLSLPTATIVHVNYLGINKLLQDCLLRVFVVVIVIIIIIIIVIIIIIIIVYFV